MKILHPTLITIKFGKKLEDKIQIQAEQAEITWDGNSFIIKGNFKATDGKDTTGNPS